MSTVKLNQYYTDWFETQYGVRQGDNLSPTLFAVYINDLVCELNQQGAGLDIDGRNMCCLLYADDIVLFAENEEKLQLLLNVLCTWCRKWHLSINQTKSNIIHFRNTGRNRSVFKFSLADDVLEYTTSYKYLGLVLDEHLHLPKSGDILADSAGRALGGMIAKYKNLNDMGYTTYSKLYHSCVAPVMDYCAEVWSTKENSSCQAVQNKALRIFLGVHRFAAIPGLHGDMCWTSVWDRHKLHKLRYWNRLIQMDNTRLTKRVFLYDYHHIRRPTTISTWSWSSLLREIFSSIDMLEVFESLSICDLEVAKARLHNKDKDRWLRAVASKPKLRLYIQIKNEFETEFYVKLNLTRSERSYVSQLRLGILPIMVETGRFRNMQLEDRLCPFCNCVEDEIHFLFNCSKYLDIRNMYLSQHMRPDVDLVSNLHLLCTAHPRPLAKYVSKSFQRRRTLLYI